MNTTFEFLSLKMITRSIKKLDISYNEQWVKTYANIKYNN